MNISLIRRYVALKAIKTVETDLFLNELKKAASDEMTDKVMEMPLEVLPRDLRRFMQKKIEERYNLPKRPRLFRKPTVGQWIANVTGIYSADDLLAYFEQETGMSNEKMATEKVGGQTVTKPFVIELIEKLEKATGYDLIDGDDAKFARLDSVTFSNLATYFSGNEGVVTGILTGKSSEASRSEFLELAMRIYREVTETSPEVSEKDFLNKNVRTLFREMDGESRWLWPIYDLEEALDVHLPTPTEKNIHEGMTVGKFMRLLGKCHEDELKKARRNNFL